MRKDGTWAGHLELLAVAHAFNVDVIIHQPDAPRLELRNPCATLDMPVLREIHISYHNGSHYGSVRSLEDTGNGPALPIQLAFNPAPNNEYLSQEETIVMELTGCKNLEYVRALLSNDHNIDSTVSMLIEE